MAGMEAARLYVGIDANTTGLTNGLRQAETQTQRFFSGMQQFSRKMSSVGNRLTVGLTLPIVGFGVAAVSAFEEADRAARQTAAVLKSTGGVANVTAKSLDKLTQSVAKQAAVDDDLIRQGANMLLTFTNVRNEAGKNNDIFNQTVSVMTDVAAAMAAASGGEMDLKSTAIQLGKALNDPLKGITALTRVGVTFTAQQKEQIKTLMESGRVMDAQKLVLAELRKEFGGSAKANATSTMKLKQAFDDLREAIGKLIYPWVQQLAKDAKRLLDAFNRLSPATQELIVKVAGFTALSGPLIRLAAPIVGLIGLVGRLALKFGTATAAAEGMAAATSAATAGSAGAGIAGAVGGASFLGPIAALAAAAIAVGAAFLYFKTQTSAAGEEIRSFSGTLEEWRKQNERNSISAYKAEQDYRRAQEMTVRSFKFSNSSLETWTKLLVKNNGLSEQETASLVGQIRATEAFGVQLDASRQKMIENLIAVGDVKRANALLASWTREVVAGLRGLAGALLQASSSARSFAGSQPVKGAGGGRRIKPPPALAAGGIVTRPTYALIGEAGPEAVVPLGQQGGFPLTVNVRLDRKRFNRDYDYAARVRGL